MLRLWNASSVAVISEDSEVFKAISQSPQLHVMKFQAFNNAAARDVIERANFDGMILWDFDSIPPETFQRLIERDSHALAATFFLCNDNQIVLASQWVKNGALDFLLKPIRQIELETRLLSASRPWVRAMTQTFEFLQTLDVDLTLVELKILLCFLANPNLSATRADLLQTVWNSQTLSSNSIHVHLFNIRKKIEKSGLLIRFNNKKEAWILSRAGKNSTNKIKEKNHEFAP